MMSNVHLMPKDYKWSQMRTELTDQRKHRKELP